MSLLKGLEFSPEVIAANGQHYELSWREWYHVAEVRRQVGLELDRVRDLTSANMLTIFGDPNWLGYPNLSSTPNALTNLSRFVSDASARGLQVALILSTHCMIPDAQVLEAVRNKQANMLPVGGHKKGEVVNGHTLAADMASCSAACRDEALAWYLAILRHLEANTPASAVAYVAIGGNPGIPFSTELGPLAWPNGLTPKIRDFLAYVIPKLAAATQIPLAVSTMAAMPLGGDGGKQSAATYQFLDTLKSAFDLNLLEWLDITSWPGIDTDAIRSKIGTAQMPKVILSDFKSSQYLWNGLTPVQAIKDQMRRVHASGAGGFWFQTWRDQNYGAFYQGILTEGGVVRQEILEALELFKTTPVPVPTPTPKVDLRCPVCGAGLTVSLTKANT